MPHLHLLLLVACASDPLPTTGDLREERFESAIVGDTYVLRLRLPPDVDTRDDWPLVVQLDPTFAGLAQFEHTTGLISTRAADGAWPDAVVLGVDYPDPGTRQRDYLPPEPPDADFGGDGADRFYAALRDEILPHVEDGLGLTPSRRVLVGHSNGGVFAAYAALRHDPAAPGPFDGVVSADFGVDAAMFTYEDWLSDRADDLPLRWYASRAVYNGAPQAITHDALFGRLTDRSYPSLALRTEALETDHGGAVVPSYDHGLAWTLAEVE